MYVIYISEWHSIHKAYKFGLSFRMQRGYKVNDGKAYLSLSVYKKCNIYVCGIGTYVIPFHLYILYWCKIL